MTDRKLLLGLDSHGAYLEQSRSRRESQTCELGLAVSNRHLPQGSLALGIVTLESLLGLVVLVVVVIDLQVSPVVDR
jgi:hypothetical protein